MPPRRYRHGCTARHEHGTVDRPVLLRTAQLLALEQQHAHVDLLVGEDEHDEVDRLFTGG